MSMFNAYLAAIFIIGTVLAVTPRNAWRVARTTAGLGPQPSQARAVLLRLSANTGWFLLLAFSMIGIAGSGYNPFLYFRF